MARPTASGKVRTFPLHRKVKMAPMGVDRRYGDVKREAACLYRRRFHSFTLTLSSLLLAPRGAVDAGPQARIAAGAGPRPPSALNVSSVTGRGVVKSLLHSRVIRSAGVVLLSGVGALAAT